MTHGPAYTSNAQGEVENANKIWRGVMRRLLHSQKAEPQQWSKFVPQANEIMNSRPITTLNHKTAAEVLHGVLGGDDELLQLLCGVAVFRRESAREAGLLLIRSVSVGGVGGQCGGCCDRVV